MFKILLFTALFNLCAMSAFAQQPDTTVAPQPQPAPQTQPKPQKQSQPAASKVYYGGTVGLTFGDYFSIRVTPWVGYKLTPKFSVGGKIGYEYIEDKRYEEKLTSHNYGGSIFTRYHLNPRIYAHGEFAYISYKYKISNLETDREWVPFILLGAGLVQPLGGRSALIIEVLVDVLQDSNSPYEDWNPFVSIGIGVGF
ncbi:MAG: hypothetical protein HUU32_19680 [Calditrichaceae bacterium]|nr:hypothetical protein [Calditrichia bacterium]NUQ43618.1 hypothetical protein [Calditrichaceae bacterium]